MNRPMNTLNISAGVPPAIARKLENLPCFKGVKTYRLCVIAEGVLGGKRTIQCRLTAMLVIVGTKNLTDEVLQIPPESSLRAYADIKTQSEDIPVRKR